MKEVRFKCPDCGKQYVIDVRTGQVIRAVEKEDMDVDAFFTDALSRVEEEEATRADRFNEALDSQEGRQDRLEDQFRDATKRAKKNPGEKPAHPFDLD